MGDFNAQLEADISLIKTTATLQENHSNLISLMERLGINIETYGEAPQKLTIAKRDWLSRILMDIGKFTLACKIGFSEFENQGIEAIPNQLSSLHFHQKRLWQLYAIMKHYDELNKSDTHKKSQGRPKKTIEHSMLHFVVQRIKEDLQHENDIKISTRDAIREILTNSEYQDKILKRIPILVKKPGREIMDEVIRIEKRMDNTKSVRENTSIFRDFSILVAKEAFTDGSTTQKMLKELLLFE